MRYESEEKIDIKETVKAHDQEILDLKDAVDFLIKLLEDANLIKRLPYNSTFKHGAFGYTYQVANPQQDPVAL